MRNKFLKRIDREVALFVTFLALVVSHFIVIIGNAISFFVLPILADWYVAFPCCSFIILVTFSNEIRCPLTRLENYLRRQLGMQQIGGFIGHYVVKPMRRK